LQYDKIFDVPLKKFYKKKKVDSTLNIYNDSDTLFVANEKFVLSYFDTPDKQASFEKKIYDILLSKSEEIKSFLFRDINYDKNSVNVTLHIRRGDIMQNLKKFENRYLCNEYYIYMLYILKRQFKKMKVNIVSTGLKSDFEKDFLNFDVNYILGSSNDSEEMKRKTMSYLLYNDILVLAPSGLSDVACVYCSGLVVCNDMKNKIKNMYVKKEKKLNIQDLKSPTDYPPGFHQI
jgi:hypothetical protein